MTPWPRYSGTYAEVFFGQSLRPEHVRYAQDQYQCASGCSIFSMLQYVVNLDRRPREGPGSHQPVVDDHRRVMRIEVVCFQVRKSDELQIAQGSGHTTICKGLSVAEGKRLDDGSLEGGAYYVHCDTEKAKLDKECHQPY